LDGTEKGPAQTTLSNHRKSYNSVRAPSRTDATVVDPGGCHLKLIERFEKAVRE